MSRALELAAVLARLVSCERGAFVLEYLHDEGCPTLAGCGAESCSCKDVEIQIGCAA